MASTLLSVAFSGVGFDDAADKVAFDELALLAGGLAQRVGCEAVEVARSEGGFVE